MMFKQLTQMVIQLRLSVSKAYCNNLISVLCVAIVVFSLRIKNTVRCCHFVLSTINDYFSEFRDERHNRLSNSFCIWFLLFGITLCSVMMMVRTAKYSVNDERLLVSVIFFQASFFGDLVIGFRITFPKVQSRPFSSTYASY